MRAAGALAVALVLPSPARSVDASGLWRVAAYVTDVGRSEHDLCSLTAVQSGDALSIAGACQGMASPVSVEATIDAATGSFSGSGSAGACPSVTVTGIVASDSTFITGDFACPSLGVSGRLNASRCGNGQLDAGEGCDDGNVVDGDCCTARCLRPAPGSACADDGNPCTADACDAGWICQHAPRTGACNDGNPCTAGETCIAGQCAGAALPDETVCDDGNPCTQNDRCQGGACEASPVACPACQSCFAGACRPAIATGCKEAAATSVTLRHLSSDSVVWRWQRGAETTAAELGDPTSGTDYEFCIYDGRLGAQGAPVAISAARAPAGPNWRAVRSGFAYRSADGDPDGLRRLRLRSAAAGKSYATVRGSGLDLALPPLQSIAMPLTVQLRSTDPGNFQCWSATYDAARRTDARQLRAERARRARHPNIVIVSLDDVRADAVDQMPALAHLASQGVSFSNSFAVNPLCAPSRASLLTGVHSRRHGVRALGGVLGGADNFRTSAADRQTIATWLQAAGYMTGLFGKYLNGYGFAGEARQGPGGGMYVPPGWTRWRAMQAPEHYGGIRGTPYTLVDERGRTTRYDDRGSDRQYSTDLLASEMRAFVADAAAQERPFLAVWMPYAGHADTPAFIPQPAMRHVHFFRDLPPFRPPSFGEADMSDKPRFMQALELATLPEAILNSTARTGSYRTLLAVDEQLALLRDDLARLGLADDTVILFTSDNGVGWGEHRLYNQAKECPYEECLRVPMIVHDPRTGAGGAVYDAAVLNIDVAPTIAELAGITPPVPTDGVSFAAWVAGSPPPLWRESFLIEHVRSVRDIAFNYTGQVSDGDQLRVLYGETSPHPRASVLFEFDAGDGVVAGAVAVPIGATAAASFAQLGAAVTAAVPSAHAVHSAAASRLDILDDSAAHTGVYLLVERDHGAVIDHRPRAGDWFGVRDVARGMTYVEHEGNEIELYDLGVDPAQLDSRHGDPAYATTRATLAQELAELLEF